MAPLGQDWSCDSCQTNSSFHVLDIYAGFLMHYWFFKHFGRIVYESFESKLHKLIVNYGVLQRAIPSPFLYEQKENAALCWPWIIIVRSSLIYTDGSSINERIIFALLYVSPISLIPGKRGSSSTDEFWVQYTVYCIGRSKYILWA